MTDAPLSPAVSIAGLSKHFPGVVALDDVTIDFPAGVVTAVMGENGAGKSTLMSILSGLQRPDAGTVTVGGRPVDVFTPYNLAHRHRVALVPQELTLCRDRIGRRERADGPRAGFSDAALDRGEDRALLARIGTPIDPTARTGRLTLAEQQLVLIARALARDCDL